MKISYMLKREDFYTINDRTLRAFYEKEQGQTKLYVYPELNAIVTAHPSRAVKAFLYTEFHVNASLLKRVAVWLYTRLSLNTYGLLAAKSFVLPAAISSDTLIYPCNKKYRIFTFDSQTVSVTPKDGFPVFDLINEIDFRCEHTADFIKPIFQRWDYGYTEQIINGYPLARAGKRTKALTEKAFTLWQSYIAPMIEEVPLMAYAAELEANVMTLCERAVVEKPGFKVQPARDLCHQYVAFLQAAGGIVHVSLSHGDLQPGNIWVEKGTDKIYLIDWESYARRSVWYDQATLFENIRMAGGIEAYVSCHDVLHMTVALEDLIFRLQELINLPLSYGTSEINDYISSLLGG